MIKSNILLRGIESSQELCRGERSIKRLPWAYLIRAVAKEI